MKLHKKILYLLPGAGEKNKYTFSDFFVFRFDLKKDEKITIYSGDTERIAEATAIRGGVIVS